MATFNFPDVVVPSTVYGDEGSGFVSGGNSTFFSISYPTPQVTDTYLGEVHYTNGTPSDGTITSIQSSYNGVIFESITGLNAPASQLFHALATGDRATIDLLLYSGNDSYQGSIYGEQIIADAGNDTVIALDGNDSIDGGDGNDDVNGNKGNDIVLGGAGTDTVRGGQGDDTVLGGDGDDGHVNGNIGNDSVSGGAGNDMVYGGQGNDTLHGDAGNDTLSGDLGNDILYGDAGADRFTIAHGGGFDWVADFNPGEGDRIQLAPGTAYTVTSISGQVVLDLGNGDELGLAGVTAGSFNSAWVVFG